MNVKTEEDADVGAHGPHFDGIHPVGFQVDDLVDACEKLERVHARRLTQKEGLDEERELFSWNAARH